MKTEKKEVKTFIIHAYCGFCDTKLVKLDSVLASYPSKYQYECPMCQTTEASEYNYPVTIYEEQ